MDLGLLLVIVDGASPPIQSRSRNFIGIFMGYRLSDVLFPVAQGQRELVIGDRQTGKYFIFYSNDQAVIIQYFISSVIPNSRYCGGRS
jgi:F0F1-type ATP synthase alpha subunit